jgi:hypothetical protein
VAVLLLAGCSNGSPAPAVNTSPSAALPSAGSPSATSPSAAATAPVSATPSVRALARCVPAFAANTLPKTLSPIGGSLGLQSATAGVHSGYDRVVFKLGASGKPGWLVEYVTSPTSDGSGNPVTVNGPSYLRVVIKNVGYPGDTGIPDPLVKRFSPGATVVREVVLDTVFEGQYTAFIGVTSTLPYRVFRLSNPARVVVDVRHC